MLLRLTLGSALVVLTMGATHWQIAVAAVALTMGLVLLDHWHARHTAGPEARGSPDGAAAPGPPVRLAPKASESGGHPCPPIHDSTSGDELVQSRPRPQRTMQELQEIEALIEKEYTDLWRFARIIVDDQSMASDLVHVTFIEVYYAWERISGYPPAGLGSWLRTVLKHKAVDMYRQRKREVVSDEVPTSARPSDTVEYIVELRLAVAACEQEISRMPPVRKTVAYLVLLKRWTTAAVAAELEITESTVRGHLFQARKQLKDAIGPRPWLNDDDEGEEGNKSA
ncbi:hypothetical protein Cme02nite_27640 [Catellatospora methionotrophica]|uniref:Uncharacterized protein n=1 Tax=Catellatospora methionotrophica TaxID=121620 RepID=A0A8J3PER1_9ACTN|nr:sigma-70 family RNA polymerase sigma factor [Catellatospora methionotrophica]GIG14432.1 hypothetical protein Cme02nite_27640 [Catellatospora methionotrophica]